MDGGAWWATVHGVAKSQRRLSDFTLTFHFHALEKEMATHSSNSCLENPRDGRAWWAAIYGVAQSWARLKRLSSSSSSVHHSLISKFILLLNAFHFGEGNGTPLQYSCLEKPRVGGAWKAAVHGVAEGWTRLSDFTFTFHFYALEKEMATHSSALAWRIPGTGSLVGCRLWGRTESDTTEAT